MNRHRDCRSAPAFMLGLLTGSLLMFAAVLGWFFAIGVRGGWR